MRIAVPLHNANRHPSFGSLFWPVLRPDLMADLVEILLDSNFPFVMTTMPLGSGIGDLVDRVKSSKIGMVVKKAPQIALLQHSSVGFCLVRPCLGYVIR